MVARVRTVVSTLDYDYTPEYSSRPSMSATTRAYEHEHDNIINNNITSLNATSPNEDHNNSIILE